VTEPSRYYTQHHAVEPPAIDALAFRPYWRRRTRLDRLLVNGVITEHEWRAAQHFRGLVEIIRAGDWPAKAFDRGAHVTGGSARGIERQFDALARLVVLRRELGTFAVDVLEAHIVDDESWVVLAARWCVHPKTARAWTVTIVKALATVIWGRT
jgi:hypothetical protein